MGIFSELYQNPIYSMYGYDNPLTQANSGPSVEDYTALLQRLMPKSDSFPDISGLIGGDRTSIERPLGGSGRDVNSLIGMLTSGGTLTGQFGEQRPSHKHSGIDIGNKLGAAINAIQDGVVSFSGPMGGYGNTIMVDNADGTQSLYSHASKLLAKVGQKVGLGDLIAQVGSTGNSTGPHLHYELRKGGKAIDPSFIGKLGQIGQSTLSGSGTQLPKSILDAFGGSQSPLAQYARMILGNKPIMPVLGGGALGGVFSGGGNVQNLIRQMSAKYGLDPRIALTIANIESGFNPNARSSAGALGVMQLMPQTAKGLGVDPYNLAGNIEGGVKYLSQLYRMFGGDLDKMAAGYNAGGGAVRKYKGIPPYAQTRAYVNKFRRLYNG